MKILYILEHYYPYIGGAEKLFQNVAEEMAHRGHEVVILTTRHQLSLPEKEIHNGVRILRVNCFNRYFFTVIALFKALSLREDFDVVHATTYNAAFPAWAYSGLKNTPSILTFHEVWGKLWFELPFLNQVKRWGFYLYEQFVIRLRFDRYIAVSKSTEVALVQAGIPEDRIIQIYNGLDYSEYLHDAVKQPAGKPFQFVFFGRLGVSKGLDLLIPAVQQLKEDLPDFHLHLVLPKRPISMLSRVVKLIEAHEISDFVTLHHELSTETLNDLITSADAVVIPSYSEGFCFVAAEACALGTPVVHSGKTALSEVVGGRQVIMKDMTVGALKTAMEMAMLGQWQILESRRFPLENSSRKYTNVYQDFVSK